MLHSYCKRICIRNKFPDSRYMQRQTRQKQAVMQALEGSGRSLSPNEIWAWAHPLVPSINLSTVYRQLKSLQDEGRVLRVELPGQPARFEAQPGAASSHRRPVARDHGHHQHPAQTAAHHHHFHCLACDQVYPIHACPGGMERMAPKGFEVQRHDLTLHGRCANCVRPAA